MLVTLTVEAHSATIAIGAGFGPTSGVMAQLISGPLLSGGGYYIGVGVFDVTPVIKGPADLQFAVNAFTEFGSATSSTTGATKGKIAASITAIPANPAIFNSNEMYLLIGNGATKEVSTQFSPSCGEPRLGPSLPILPPGVPLPTRSPALPLSIRSRVLERKLMETLMRSSLLP